MTADPRDTGAIEPAPDNPVDWRGWSPGGHVGSERSLQWSQEEIRKALSTPDHATVLAAKDAEIARLREANAYLGRSLAYALRHFLAAEEPKDVDKHVKDIVDDLKSGRVGSGARKEIRGAVDRADKDAARLSR